METFEHQIRNYITTTGTQQTVFSFDTLPNKSYSVELYDINVYKSDYSDNMTGKISGSFLRGAGNISRKGINTSRLHSSFGGPPVVLDVNENTGTNKIEVNATGSNGVSLTWNLKIKITYSI